MTDSDKIEKLTSIIAKLVNTVGRLRTHLIHGRFIDIGLTSEELEFLSINAPPPIKTAREIITSQKLCTQCSMPYDLCQLGDYPCCKRCEHAS